MFIFHITNLEQDWMFLMDSQLKGANRELLIIHGETSNIKNSIIELEHSHLLYRFLVHYTKKCQDTLLDFSCKSYSSNFQLLQQNKFLEVKCSTNKTKIFT